MSALPALPLPAGYLIHCEGRPTLTRTAPTRELAEAKAAALASEWPGHDFDVYERIASHSAKRGQPPRQATGRLNFGAAK